MRSKNQEKNYFFASLNIGISRKIGLCGMQQSTLTNKFANLESTMHYSIKLAVDNRFANLFVPLNNANIYAKILKTTLFKNP